MIKCLVSLKRNVLVTKPSHSDNTPTKEKGLPGAPLTFRPLVPGIEGEIGKSDKITTGKPSSPSASRIRNCLADDGGTCYAKINSGASS